MVSCEMCGEQVNSLSNITVAGTAMQVCRNCTNLGKEVQEQKKAHTFYRKQKGENTVEEVVENYASLINSALARKNLNHHQLAMALNIKESNLNKYLSNKLKPDLETIKKIATYLEINFIYIAT